MSRDSNSEGTLPHRPQRPLHHDPPSGLSNCGRGKPRLVWILLLVSALGAQGLWAHGSMLEPRSRVYKCRFDDNPENPADPACAAAVALAGTPQFLYDYAGIRQAKVAGQHQVWVPDGQLCSGGGPEYAGLDLPREDWRATSIEADALGQFEFIYRATAPHATQDMLFYITPQGWDPTQPLTWADLDAVDDPANPGVIDPFCHLTEATAVSYPQDPTLTDLVYRMPCPLPERNGRHIIYHVWQRSDSPEAFYGCIDVLMGTSNQIFSDSFESGDFSAWSP